jgi:hypothetical protein
MPKTSALADCQGELVEVLRQIIKLTGHDSVLAEYSDSTRQSERSQPFLHILPPKETTIEHEYHDNGPGKVREVGVFGRRDLGAGEVSKRPKQGGQSSRRRSWDAPL